MTAMDWLRKTFPGVFVSAPVEKPRIVIMTPWGPTTESARLQGAINMKLDPVARERCEKMMIEKLGDEKLAMEEMHRRYPETYQEE